MAVPWWAKVAGGQKAVQQMANFNATPALRNAWYTANMTRLNNNPELHAAVQKAGVDYATARRLDMSFQAMQGQQKRNLVAESGSSSQMIPSDLTVPAAAADAAGQAKQQQDQQQSSGGGLIGWFKRQILGFNPEVKIIAPDAVQKAQQTGLIDSGPGPGSGLMPQDWANWVNSAASKTLDVANTAFNAVISPIAGPMAGGSANKADWETHGTPQLTGPLGIPLTTPSNMAVATAATDYARGVKQQFTGVDPQQAADMRAQGYDPDSWISRYNYYGNYEDAHPIISNTVVSQAKQAYNPQKVDMVREILTSGALQSYDRTAGLSQNAQVLLQNIQANKDPEASAIMAKLADPTATSLGGHLADAIGLEEGTTARTLLSDAGDMAAYWFVAPDMVAGKAYNAYKMARFGVDMDTDAIKAAIMERNPISSRWDDILDRVDNIHVLSQSPKAEDQAKASQALNDFQQRYSDLGNIYSFLAGTRAGAVRGAVFKAPEKVAESADMTPVLGLEYVDNPAERTPMWQLRDQPGQEVSQDARDAARAYIAENIGDALIADHMNRGLPIVGNQMLMPGQIRVTTPVRKALTAVTDKLFGTGADKNGLLFQQLKDAENKGLLDFSTAENPQTAVSHVIDSAQGGQWVRENYTHGGLRARAALAASRFQMFRDGATVSFTDPSGLKAYQGLVKFIMPKGQAALMAQKWAVSDPATRSAMWNQLQDTLANARAARDTQAGVDYWKQALKGREQVTPAGMRPLEAYSSPDVDMIETPAGKMSAAMYSTQFASGARVPPLQEILKNTESVGLISWLARVSHSRLSTVYAKMGKVGQVGTTSNMQKQVLEGRVLQGLEDPAGAARTTAARIGLSARNAEDRVELNNALRQARTILKSGDMQYLTPLAAQGKTEEYIAQVEDTLAKRGQSLSPVLRELLENMDLTEGPNAGIQAVAAGRSAARLAATRVVDPLRTLRANVVKRIGIGTKYTEPFAYDWLDRTDDGFHDDLVNGVERLLGDQRGNYVTGGAIEDMAQVHNALDAANRYARVGLRNTQGYLGTAGDVGAQRWANALGYRLADPVGSKVHEAVAHVTSLVAKHSDEIEKVRTAARNKAMRPLGEGEMQAIVNDAIAKDVSGEGGLFGPLVERWARRDAEADPAYKGHVAQQQYHQQAAEEVQDRMDDLRRMMRRKGADREAIKQELADAKQELSEHVTQANEHEAAAEDLYKNKHLGPMRAATKDFTDPQQVAEWLLKDRPEGEAYRLEGRRGMYIDGRYVESQADKDSALAGWAGQMTEDAHRYLGLRTEEIDDARMLNKLDPDKVKVLAKVAKGERPTTEDLASIPDEIRPEQVQAPVIVGKQAVDPKLKLADWLAAKASQEYELFVGGPIRRLLHDPQTAAAKWEAMTAMEPLARTLTERGMEPEHVYNLLDTLAAKHAVARIARYADNPHVTSYFAALSNNFLWYERAMEDFARRAMNIVKADPAVIARAHIMWETAQHAGFVYRQQGTDDDGNPQTQWMFTWPGSGLAMKAVNEAAMRLGLADDAIVKTPVWQDFASPVQYLSPSLSNPIGFSTNPMLGMPLRFVRDVFPQTQADVNDWLTALEGGVRGFANQGQSGGGIKGVLGDMASELMPVYVQRFWNAYNPDDRDSETASALKNALIYMDAAGKLPGPQASADERQQALDELRQQVQNIMYGRAVLASFLPATPGTMTTNVDDIGDVDEFDKLRGINSVRGEWFQLLEDMTQKYGSDRAMSEASTAWLQRDLGSIIHPEDFTVGTSGAPGGEQTGDSFGSSQNLVNWMLQNRDFLKEYGQAAYKLLPAMTGPYYDQIGYQTQLRTGLRQHKDSTEMYNALIQAQGDRAYYSALDARDAAMDANPQQQQALYDQFDQYVANLKTANPVWASAEDQAPDFVYTTIAPMVQKMATATDLPPQVARLQPQLQLMSQLYDEYRSELAHYPTESAADVQARLHIESQYRNTGDTLFKGGDLGDLWSAMKVYED